VSEVMQTNTEPLPIEASLDAAQSRFREKKVTSWPVGDHASLRGVISSHQIETLDPPPATIRDLIKSNGSYPYVHADHPLSYALEQMRHNGVDVVPVVSRANIREMQGVVTLTGILSTYGLGGDSGTTPAR